MNCCIEPGQVLIVPLEGGRNALAGEFERHQVEPPAVLYSVEDVLRHCRVEELARRSGDGTRVRFRSYPVLALVEPGSELEAAAMYRTIKGVSVALPNYRTAPSMTGLQFDEAYVEESLEGSGLFGAGPNCGRGVSVAMLDSGVDPSAFSDLPALPSQFDTDAPRDGAQGCVPYDPTGHGTVVATLIRRGAPGVDLLPIKVMAERGNLMATMAGLYVAIAASQPDIFNLSLAVTAETGTCQVCGQPHTDVPVTLQQLKMLFGHVDQIYQDNGLSEPLLIAAAGNVSAGATLAVPASLENVLAVGACHSSGRPAEVSSYSRYGAIPQDRFVRAPGGQPAPGRPFANFARHTSHWHGESFFGTSFAAPLATAVAARYLCATKDSPCGKYRPLRSTREFLMQCVRDGADRSFLGFDTTSHGLGIARYEPSAVAS